MISRALSFVLGLALAGAAPAPIPFHDAPRVARDTRLSGLVRVEALVDTTGRVQATSIARSQPALDDEAAARVRAMRFEPLRAADRLVPSLQIIPVTFEPPPGSAPADAWAETRCSETAFKLELDVRPDSSGTFQARWTARGLKSQELFVIVLYPDGAAVDTTRSWYPQRFRDEPEAVAWPAWHREGRDLRNGTTGTFSFTLPEAPWWNSGRIAVVVLFHDVFDGRTVLRQRAYRVDRDAMGLLLVGDPAATPCGAGPWFPGR